MIKGAVALAASGLVMAGERGQGLDQGGFAGAVFADQDGDGALEGQLEVGVLEPGQVERVVAGGQGLSQGDALQEGRGEVGAAGHGGQDGPGRALGQIVLLHRGLDGLGWFC